MSIEEFESSWEEEFGGNLWSRRSEVLGEIGNPETASTRSYYRPCTGSVSIDIDTILLITLQILLTLYPVFYYLG